MGSQDQHKPQRPADTLAERRAARRAKTKTDEKAVDAARAGRTPSRCPSSECPIRRAPGHSNGDDAA